MAEGRSADTDGKVLRPESGTPQGGIISPVLANVYLHYALDLWFERIFSEVVNAGRFCIVMPMTLSAASDEQRKHSGFTTSWKKGYGSSGWNWRETKHGSYRSVVIARARRALSFWVSSFAGV